MEIGKNIARHRKANNMTAVELAALVGVKPQYISQIENGKRTPSLKVIRKLAKIFNTTSSELLNEVPESIPAEIRKLVQAAEGLNKEQVDIVISIVKEINSKYKG
jgi:transcriptional regulator with XRE-family HTH domain